MYQSVTMVLNDERFHELLLKLDRDLAALVRADGCPSCHAALHAAPFARKPRGMPKRLGREHRQRLSFCCAKDGCRQRDTGADRPAAGTDRRQPPHGVALAAMVVRDLHAQCLLARRHGGVHAAG
jgi:hypothetical protein